MAIQDCKLNGKKNLQVLSKMKPNRKGELTEVFNVVEKPSSGGAGELSGLQFGPLTDTGVARILREGFLQVGKTHHKFTRKPQMMRVAKGEPMIPNGLYKVTCTVYLRDDDATSTDERIALTVGWSEEGTGRWVPSVKATRNAGGSKGREKAVPTDGDDLFD